MSGKEKICLIIKVYASTGDYKNDIIEAFHDDVNKTKEEN